MHVVSNTKKAIRPSKFSTHKNTGPAIFHEKKEMQDPKTSPQYVNLHMPNTRPGGGRVHFHSRDASPPGGRKHQVEKQPIVKRNLKRAHLATARGETNHWVIRTGNPKHALKLP